MKKIFTSLAFAALLIPSVSFAAQTQTTYSPQYIASLKQMILLLEQELQALFAQQGMQTTTSTTAAVTTVPTISVKPFLSNATTVASSTVTFDLKFAVKTNGTTIDIPQNSVGIQYQISNTISGTQSSFVLNCPSSAVYDGTSYCEVPPNTTANFDFVSTMPMSDWSSNTPTPQLTVSQIKYFTNVNTGQQAFSYYQPSGLTTSSYFIYQK